MEQLIGIFKAWLTPLIAVVVTYVAWRQWRVNVYRLRLDLFEKRYAVFDATRKFLSLILRKATFEMNDFYEFRANVSDADFLFKKDVVKYLGNIDDKALQLNTTQDTYKPLLAGDERTKLVKEEKEILKWLTDQLPELKKIFTPYINFKKI